MSTLPVSVTELVAAFLALPPEALPSAVVDRHGGAEDTDHPWEGLRATVRGQLPVHNPGEVVILTADREGWRAGVRVRLPSLRQPGAVL